jgi:hypothetical protein
MENMEILQKIVQAVESYKDSEGWADLALIGKPLTDLGVNYKALGYIKLRELLEKFPELEIKRDETSHKLPVLYVKVNQTQKRVNHSTYYNQTKSETKSNQISSKLMDWAYMGDYQQTISKLKNMALKKRDGITKIKIQPIFIQFFLAI